MDAKKNQKSLLIGGVGLVLQIVGFVMVQVVAPEASQPAAEPSLQAAILALAALGLLAAGTVALVVGLCIYASGKGYHPALGLLGLLSIIGLVILALLPDKHAEQEREERVAQGENLPVEASSNAHTAVRMSLWLSVLSLICFLAPCINIAMALAAVVLGHLGRASLPTVSEPLDEAGKTIASLRTKTTWSLAMGYIGLALGIITTVLIMLSNTLE